MGAVKSNTHTGILAPSQPTGTKQQYPLSRTADGRLSSRWIESGGPPVTPPTHRGFGTRIMENMIGQLRGEVRFDWRAKGLTCEIALPLA
jgi:two-component sensor histidine kinase